MHSEGRPNRSHLSVADSVPTKKNCNRHQSKYIFLSLLLRSIAILYSYSYAILKPHLYILSAIGSFTFWILTIHSIMFILQPYFVPGSVNEPCSRSWIFNAHKVPTRQPGWGDVRGLARHPSIVSLQAKHFTSMRFIFFFLAKNFLFWSKSTLTRRCIIFRYFYWSAFPVFGAGKRKKKKHGSGGQRLYGFWHLTSDITLWSCNIKATLTKSVIISSPLSIIFALEPLWLFFTGHLVAFLILCFFQVFPGARCLAVIVSGTLRHYATIDPIGTRRMGLDRLAPKASGVKSFGHVLHFAN